MTIPGNTGSLVKAGYVFIGWNTKNDGTGVNYTQGAAFTMSNKDCTLYANWYQGQTYNVTYNINMSDVEGSEPVDTTNYKSDSVVYVMDYGTMLKTGYGILNWNTAQNGTGKAYQPGETFILADDVDLYAIWSANQYTITFDPMGGSPTTPLEKTVNYDSTYGTLPSSNRDGYNFAGWFDEYNNPVNENTVVRIAKNHVIHAGWTPNVYPVYFEPAPGEIIPDVTYKDVTFGLQFGDLPVPALAGFTFNGWLEIEGEIEGHVSSETVVTLARPIYLEADWKGNTYTITCELRFNEGTAGSLEMTLNYGIGYTYSEIWWISDRQGCQDCEIYGLPTQQDVYDYFELDEHWNEYTFNGIWYSDISCTIPINNDTEITNINNHSVYGKLQSP